MRLVIHISFCQDLNKSLFASCQPVQTYLGRGLKHATDFAYNHFNLRTVSLFERAAMLGSTGSISIGTTIEQPRWRCEL